MPSVFPDGCEEGYVQSAATSDVTLTMVSGIDDYQQLTVTLCVPDSEWIRSSVVDSITEYLERRQSVEPMSVLLAAVLVLQVILVGLSLRKRKG